MAHPYCGNWDVGLTHHGVFHRSCWSFTVVYQPFSSPTGGGNRQDAGALDDERLKILEEREKWEKEKNEMQTERNAKDYQRAMASVDNAILDLLPKTKEAKQTCDLLNRVTMTFDVVLEKGNDGIPRVKVCVENSEPKLSILIDPQEFLPKLSLLKDEMMKLRYLRYFLLCIAVASAMRVSFVQYSVNLTFQCSVLF